MMKKNIFSCLLIIGMIISLITPINAEILPEGLEINLDYAFYTKYVSRGFTNDNDPVLQSGIYAQYKGFTLTVWNSMDIRNREGDISDEVDYILDYTYSLESLSLTFGHAYFDYPGWNGYAKEFSLGAGYDTFLSPSITWMHDYVDREKGGGDGDYIVVNAGHSIALDNETTLDLSGEIGYNSDYYIDGTGGHIGLGVGFTVPLTDKLTCSPSIQCSIPFGDLADEDMGDQKTRIYGGIIVAY
jgi:hypothetical protein